MFINKLRLAIPAEQHTKIVEPGDDTLQFDAVDQEDGYRNLGFPDMIQKRVLQILSVGSHDNKAFFSCGLLAGFVVHGHYGARLSVTPAQKGTLLQWITGVSVERPAVVSLTNARTRGSIRQ